MVVTWLLNAAATVVGWLAGVMESAASWPTIAFGPVSLTAPVPLLSAGQIGVLNSWLTAALAVGLCLGIGRVLLFIYRLVPFNG